MTWLLWRQHRFQLFVTAALIAGFAIALTVTGIHMAHIYDDWRSTCAANGTCSFQNLFQGYGAIVDTVHLSIIVPVLFGGFGALLIAREVEQSTNVLAWTQTITRRRWLLAKLAMAVAATLVISAAISVLVTWWSGTPNALYGDRFQGAQFDTQNVLPVAFAFFGVALGIGAGALIRRVLPAIAAMLGVFVALRVFVAVYLRPHYMKPVSAVFSFGSKTPLPAGSWTISQRIVDASGHSLTGRIPIPGGCRALAPPQVGSCLSRAGIRQVITYQPASRYWHFQTVEAAIFAVLGIVLIGVAYAYTARHDA
jgi:hypothetical protein